MTSEHRRYAILVGVSKYDDDVSELPCAKNDAYHLYLALQRHSGFATDRVYLLTNEFDSKSDVHIDPPTRSNVLQKIKYVCDAAGPEDLIFLYFAGHGAEVSKTPYLITSDTRMDVLNQTALNVDDLNKMMESARAKCIVRVFDACRSPFAEGRGLLGRMTDGMQQAVMKCATGWASFSSCSSGELAHESGELNHGVFTYYLCEGLSGKARNQQGSVTIESLVDYVKMSVANWCDRQTLKQTPHFQSDLSGSLVLSTAELLPLQAETPVESPFNELIAGIEQHLCGTADDTRRLTFTSADEWATIASSVYTRLTAKLAEFSHPAIRTEIGEVNLLHGFRQWPFEGRLSEELKHDMSSFDVHKEFAGDTAVCIVQFISTEVVIPKTRLYVVVVRFNFFYWLWYCHVCVPEQLQGEFKPNPPWTKGFFTFKPSGARDLEKTDRTLRELLLRASREILAWATQLGEYVEARVGPLRKVGPIID